MVHTAEDHAEEEPGGVLRKVTGRRNLELTIIDLAYDSYKFGYADFHAHGSPGGIALGNDVLDIETIGEFSNKGYDQLFDKGATIKFVGCNVGEDAIGEYFLYLVGQTFLRRNGGKVMGNTAAGFALTSDPIHPFGRWVTVNVSAGGAVSFSGHSHLDLKKIDARIANAQRRLAALRGTEFSLTEDRTALENAIRFITPAARRNSYENMYWACYYLDEAEKHLAVTEKLHRNHTTPFVGSKY